MPVKRRWPGLLPGLLLVSVGGGLLAREFGYLPAHVRLVDFWPLLVVVLGVSSLFRARGVVGFLIGFAFLAMGGVMLAGNLGFMTFPAGRLWPGLIVLLGLAFLFGGAHRRGSPPRGVPPAGGDGRYGGWSQRHTAHGAQTVESDRLSKQITAAGAQFRIESQAWKGGELGVTMGGVELDLRNARLDPEGAHLDVRVLMGGIDIRVPDTWQILCDVTPFFGGAEDSTRTTQGSTNAPRLRITGAVTLGGVDVRN